MEYDLFGRVERQSQPFYTNDPIYWSKYIYDALDRVTTTYLPHLYSGGPTATTTQSYGVDSLGSQELITQNTLGNTKTTYANALGQIEEIIDAASESMLYSYDAQGNLLQTTDAANNQITLAYDLLGRRTSMDDPDMGLTSFTFNAFGEQTSQTDAKLKTITLKYDKLGRMVERQVPSITSGIDLSTFVYDSAANGIGAIASLSGPNGSATSYAYDPFGRADSTTTTIRGQSFNQSYTYNADGFLATQRYPDSGAGNEFSVKYNYLNGYLSSITGVENQQGLCVEHWRAEEYDAAGRVKQDTLGTLVSTTRTYDQAQGVLQRIESILQVNNQATVQDLNYTYDANNNLSTRSDAMTSVSESFEYDLLDRLRFHHKGSDTTEVRYDAIGNITYKSDVGSYSYGANDAGPHALTRVELPLGTDPLMSFEVNWKWNGQDYLKTLPNIHGQTFQYDGNGNVNISGDRRVWWTAFDKPYRMERVDAGLNITSGSDFEYDATFNRIVKEQDDGQITIYLDKDYEKITEHNGDIKHRYTISTGGSTIQIERDNNSNVDQPKYLLGDNLGSTNVILNAAGEVEQRQAFDPWGMRLNIGDPTAVNSLTNKGYTGHEMDDEVGLTNMNARIYDPYLGRFLSADPVLPDAYDMQSFNRYAYVLGNPLKYVDPTGNIETIIVIGSRSRSGFGFGGSGGRGRDYHSTETYFDVETYVDQIIEDNKDIIAAGIALWEEAERKKQNPEEDSVLPEVVTTAPSLETSNDLFFVFGGPGGFGNSGSSGGLPIISTQPPPPDIAPTNSEKVNEVNPDGKSVPEVVVTAPSPHSNTVRTNAVYVAINPPPLYIGGSPPLLGGLTKTGVRIIPKIKELFGKKFPTKLNKAGKPQPYDPATGKFLSHTKNSGIKNSPAGRFGFAKVSPFFHRVISKILK